jgi:ATP-dependent helicase/nuclease subunit A
MSVQPAYRAAGRDCTREAFYALACDPARSVVVEACAGAGKTWMLVARILRALLAGGQPREIVAITFTRKAAGEMRERLHDELRLWAGQTQPVTDAERIQALVDRGLPPAEARALAPALQGLHERLLKAGQAVQIHTFHGWFTQLMRGAPMELLDTLGLHAGMTLVEDIEDLRPELMRRFHAALLDDAERLADYQALAERHGRSRLAQWWALVLDRRTEIELADQAGVLINSVVPATADGRAPIERIRHDTALRATLAVAAQAAGRHAGKDAQKSGTRLQAALELDDAEQAFDEAWAALFTDKGTLRKVLEDIAAVGPAEHALLELQATQEQHGAHADHVRLVHLARVLLRQWGETKRARGVADMPDLERCALALLGDSVAAGWVQQRLDAQVRHLLIDEFQDTSPLQWQALQGWLGAYAGAGGGQAAPSVFIVGDPKQSIYRFRRAEPRVFAAAREFVEQGLGGVVLECDHTRRNHPGVLAALNAVFTQAQLTGAYAGFRPHSTEVAGPPAPALFTLPDTPRDKPAARRRAKGDEDEPPVWRDTLTVPRSDPEQQPRLAEAALVAAAVHELVSGAQRMAPGDILVLSRTRRTLVLVEEALRTRDIPCIAAEEQRLADLPEARDLIALLDVLASPGHDLSLAQALRSPIFGAGDEHLLALAERARGHGGRWWPALRDWADAPPALQPARAWLPRWMQAARQLPPHDLLDRVVHEGDLLGRMLAAAPPARRAQAGAALRGLLAQSLALEGGRYATPYGFVRALRTRALKIRLPGQRDAVQLLTVHGAKGLEARAVFVVDADPKPPPDTDPALLVDWPVHAAHPVCAAFIRQGNRPPPTLAALHAHERAERAREELNGLYVAMTRAKERLVFSRTPPAHAGQDGPTWWHRSAALAEAWVPAAPVTGPGLAGGGAPLVQVPVLPDAPPRPSAPMPHEQASSGADDSPSARLGRALHRRLEWAAPGRAAGEGAVLSAAAAAEFGLDAAMALEVERLAQAILQSPSLARFFDPAALRWAGNEVSVAEAGDLLRIDRLVQLDGDGSWWVLDYKLSTRPQAAPELRAQLARYRRAVQRLAPGEPVRAAFVTADGRLVEPELG